MEQQKKEESSGRDRGFGVLAATSRFFYDLHRSVRPEEIVKINSILICNQSFVRMDPQHTGHMLNHLTKQNELLKEAHKSMTQELQKLEVEHEMMMRKLYELTNSHSVNKKKMDETQNVSEGREIVEVSSSTSIVTTDDE
ncbi:hypothetical protein V5N11_016808 [Cardamine amara subsp. amara]|uniref:Uncharacterized protein n=1 Tax=Cardamine amara subsp. amara TaxID=228776 RepID=A0ABD0Z6T7_CARAN